MDLKQFSLEGKTALITGGSRGIGEATAVTFAKAGADVAVTSRKLPDLERVAAEIKELGRNSLAAECHVGRMEQLQPLVDKVQQEFGKIDILVNNAGTSFYGPSLEITEKGWDAVLNLNLKGVFFLSQAVARLMVKQGGGSIINVSSTAGFQAQIPTAHYSISKAGVIMVTKTLAKEWAQYNIRVNCIAPGGIETRMLDAMYAPLADDQKEAAKQGFAQSVPLGRAGEPQEIADVMLFLASQASSYVTGQTLLVDGGVLL
ncbi:MAG: glucose 1-dehydrogenase [Deltaproteobacteria bacterium]|mgnify:CR=1 FL=1|jgi:NAD(P)-dependent dehydrogenase (short-subunit alcohol dehydrogenase family)|nr:glucose 1-dehydrogenase [Deltaproteobacteria bacterium]MBT4266749.1 glucose 1-dehydrogenase [Deltaproteobacteria bacterium]MBT4641114.1 glucose 1-dehydrogenase [Deltaproteobacteria bacterium]MBT6505004.1 glucose 1-dehydrogenase [Deltaproteobacteria bacterium]MBT7155096.1 glucose 1-dehydrogenase [Deltaproteobacteria bacterium]